MGHCKWWGIVRSDRLHLLFQLCGGEIGSLEFTLTRTVQVTLLKRLRINTVGTPRDELSHYYVLQSLPPFYKTSFFFLIKPKRLQLFSPGDMEVLGT